MTEWPKVHDWKSCVPQGTEGSNPSLSSAVNSPPAPSLAREIRTLGGLAVPFVAAQVGMMTLGVVEAAIAGRAGTGVLAAVSLGNAWTHGTGLAAMGVVLGADPIISQAYGAGDTRGVALTFQRSIILSLILGAMVAVAWLFTAPVLRLAGQDPRLVADGARFVAVQAPTAFGFLLFIVNRQYLAGRGLVAPAFWVMLAVNLINLVVTWWLVFGGAGVPALGVLGAGLGGAVTRLLMAGLLLAATFAFGLHRAAWVPWSREVLATAPMVHILRLGLPIGLQFGLEVWAFQLTTLLAGRMGLVPLGAHTIVLNLASFSFMFPLGISMAASVRVGNLVGAGDLRAARRSALLALALGAGVMSLFALTFYFLRWHLPALYSSDPQVTAAAASILPIAAGFQMLDGTQVVASGILRGLGRTRPAAVATLVGYYLLALPLGWLLGLRHGLSLAGLWWGLATGLAVVAVALVTWILRPGTFAVARTTA
jgi:MATE family multidrug resistance protein